MDKYKKSIENMLGDLLNKDESDQVLSNLFRTESEDLDENGLPFHFKFSEKSSLTPNEILSLTEEERKELYSVCWHDGDYSCPRCWCQGVENFNIKKAPWSESTYLVTWSDSNGDPRIKVFSLDRKLHKSGDGEWDYGVYKLS